VSAQLDRDELDAYFALVAAGDLVQRALTAQFAEHDLTPVKFGILAQLLDAPGGVRMRELASELVHSRSGLSYQVAQLEREGLVDRIASPGDERGVLAVITQAGAARVRRAFPGHLALVRANFLDLLPEGGAATLRDLLAPVVSGLRATSNVSAG
jgi:DNA-binding MarR family transcriptional regulator